MVALALLANPIVDMDDAFATKKKKGNIATQSISQSQSSSQNSLDVSGGDTIGSGNNINIQIQENPGNNALA